MSDFHVFPQQEDGGQFWKRSAGFRKTEPICES